MLDAQPSCEWETTQSRFADFPALAELGVPQNEFDAISLQGFVCQEKRYNRWYFKLRYRFGGKQRVRYVAGEARADAVRAELEVLQQKVRNRREIAALMREGTMVLRAAKQSLAPLLAARGYHYHGLAVRRRRP